MFSPHKWQSKFHLFEVYVFVQFSTLLNNSQWKIPGSSQQFIVLFFFFIIINGKFQTLQIRFIYTFKKVRKREYQKSLKSLFCNFWLYWKKKKPKKPKTPNRKTTPKAYCFKKYKIAKTSVTDAPQRNLSCKHLWVQLILSTSSLYPSLYTFINDLNNQRQNMTIKLSDDTMRAEITMFCCKKS